jgi:hypothetical protein
VSPRCCAHTAPNLARQQTGDARLVAAYLAHADLSIVSRYAHVAGDELHEAAATLPDLSAAAAAGRRASATRGGTMAGPACGKVFLVSALIHRKKGRDCPRCGRSHAKVHGGAMSGGTAWIKSD